MHAAQSLAELTTTDFWRIPYAVAPARKAEDISAMEDRPYITRCVFGGSLIQSSPFGHSGFLYAEYVSDSLFDALTEHVVHVPRLLLKVACSCPYSLRVGGSSCSLQKGARPTAPARSDSSAMYARSATRLI